MSSPSPYPPGTTWDHVLRAEPDRYAEHRTVHLSPPFGCQGRSATPGGRAASVPVFVGTGLGVRLAKCRKCEHLLTIWQQQPWPVPSLEQLGLLAEVTG